MSQHDYVIANASGSSVRSDLNNALAAIVSNNSGTSAPSATFANMVWYDTTNNALKIRNEDNDAWITILTLDQTNDRMDIVYHGAGTSAAPSVSFSNDSNTGLYNSSADTIAFSCAGAFVASITTGAALFSRAGGDNTFTARSTTSGNAYFVSDAVGGYSGLQGNNATAAKWWVGTRGTNDGRCGIYVTNSTALDTQAADFATNGNVRFGTGSIGSGITTSSGNGFEFDYTNNQLRGWRSGAVAVAFGRRSSDGSVLEWYRDSANVGNVSVTATATSYNTTSDYRAKDDLKPLLKSATATLEKLKIYSGVFKAKPDTRQLMAIAHEVQEHYPEAVTGTKDEVDENGNPVLQGIDYSKLVPLLVAALQETNTRLAALEAAQ